ncbi:ergothioneine biosynthesis protein EgtB [Leptolyngbya sp. FACHB-321]|uniref:SUMF1/EgtB/PvdO family nonheme iron enzyme n=1 Tax=Leptolyngbya sp. FACHB-321 TaxID=2692807 RepID=UPI001683D186|nr:ergothioneine biosynthesis protein EgtB [Leptolyngbya sp. FACHB-321]
MEACRLATLALFQTVDYNTFCQQAHPDFSPIGWHLGHIAYTEALWLLEHLAGLPPQYPQYRRLFAADTLPKAERVYLPDLAEVQTYLSAVRKATFAYLETAPLDEQERLWRWLLQHESQHGETIAIVLALIKRQKAEGKRQKVEESGQPSALRPQLLAISRQGTTQNSELKTVPSTSLPLSLPTPHSRSAERSRRSPLPTPQIHIPAGSFECGNESLEALDNERPVHRVYVETYWIDRAPVTCKQYQAFMSAGGYQEPRWWSDEGWAWLQSAQVIQPLYWSDAPDRANHPVCGVSWYEADAYARFVGKRLPTEAEWEKAASWNPIVKQRQTYPWGEAVPSEHDCNCNHAVGQTTPVGAYPAGTSPFGCEDLLGNVWEWTNSWFDRYTGFEAYPYRGYSEAYFDGQHRILKGGSWATQPSSLRCAFRNWYHPHVREIFAGFRCVSDVG